MVINLKYSIIYLKRGYMKINVKNYSSVMVLISSSVFFILGAVMFTKPDAVVLFVSYVIGCLVF